jgi:hypothetical protein
MTIATVTLDTVIYQDDDFQTYLASNGIIAEVIQESGPAGGWPEIQYTGERSVIEEMVRQYWCTGETADDAEVLAAIKDA